LPPQSHIRCLTAEGALLYAGTDAGAVFTSNDQGNNWIPTGDGLPGSAVLSLQVQDSHLYAGLNAGGVWRSPLPLPMTDLTIHYYSSQIVQLTWPSLTGAVTYEVYRLDSPDALPGELIATQIDTVFVESVQGHSQLFYYVKAQF